MSISIIANHIYIQPLFIPQKFLIHQVEPITLQLSPLGAHLKEMEIHLKKARTEAQAVEDVDVNRPGILNGQRPKISNIEANRIKWMLRCYLGAVHDIFA